VPILLKSGSLNTLETSEPVKACNGIALPLALHTCVFQFENNRKTPVVTGERWQGEMIEINFKQTGRELDLKFLTVCYENKILNLRFYEGLGMSCAA
jgi:hypothetical protein